MKNMSIDEIVKMYRDGYSIYNPENNTNILQDISPNIVSMDYSSQCSGGTTLTINNTGSLQGTYGTVNKGRVWAQKFYADFSCLDMVEFSMKRDANVDFYIEVRKDYGGKPQGVPLVDDSGLVYRTPLRPYSDIPSSMTWAQHNVPTILPSNGYYWICFVPSDFYDSPSYIGNPTYDRFDLKDRTDMSANPSSHYDSGTWTNSSTFGFAIYKQANYLVPSVAQIYNACWGSSLGASCSTPPERPAVTTGTSFTIKADLANNGATGKIGAVFKANGTQISDQNINSLATFPGGGLWSPTVAYTMPNTDVSLIIDGYGWDGASWVLNQTVSATISKSTPTCTGITLTPYSASVEIGQSVTFTATTTPSTQSFTVNFRLVETGTSLGTRSTSGGTCQLVWNTSSPSGLIAGNTYHVIAEVVGQCWSTSPGSSITLSAPIQQWTLSTNVKDTTTLFNISGASVTVSASGPPAGTQTLTTDLNGNAQFIVTQGSISVTISKTGYNTRTITDSIFSNKSLQCNITPTTPSPGSLNFITVPGGAEVFFGTISQGTTDPTTGVLQIDNIPAEQIVSYTVKKLGYNDSPGSVTVQSGTILNVPVTLTPVTPTTGDVCIKSNPSGASIKIDGVSQTGKTTAMSGGGCVSSNIIYTLTQTSHSYELSLVGFENNAGTFTPTVGTTIQVDVGALTPSQTVGNATITSTPPGARIYIDNVDSQYITPATIQNIVQGSHTYKLVLSGYIDGTGSFTITAGQTITVPNVVLTQRLGSLRFLSTPTGAEILIGGISKGVTTISGLTVSNLPIGSTDFIARLATYDEYHGNVIVEEDITKDVTIVLVLSIANKGSLHIESNPPGAEIFIDGTDKLLTTPQTFSGMDTGGHEYELVMAGYQTATDTFIISANQTTTINETLQASGGGGGAGMLFGLIGIAALGIMMTSKEQQPQGKSETGKKGKIEGFGVKV